MAETLANDWGEILKLEGADGHFTGSATEGWTQGRAIYGGLVGALMQRAAERVLPVERSPRSLLINFIGPLQPGEFSLNASVLRAGRAVTQVHVEIEQGGAVMATLTGAYGAKRTTSLQILGERVQASELGTPESLIKWPHLDGLTPPFANHFEHCTAADCVPFGGSERGNMAGYVAVAGGGPRDAAGLLLVLDSWPPTVLNAVSGPAAMSSATWMIDFLTEPPAPGSLGSEQYAYKADTVFAQGGYASTEARLWSPSGELLLASRQLVVEFSQPPESA